jgi:hypothetical protein
VRRSHGRNCPRHHTNVACELSDGGIHADGIHAEHHYADDDDDYYADADSDARDPDAGDPDANLRRCIRQRVHFLRHYGDDHHYDHKRKRSDTRRERFDHLGGRGTDKWWRVDSVHGNVGRRRD